MQTVFRWMVHLLVIPVCVLTLPGVWGGFLAGVQAWAASDAVGTTLLGAMLGVGLAVLTRRYAPLVHTFEHELTHAVTGLPFGLIPTRFVVTRGQGGLVQQWVPPMPAVLSWIPVFGSVVSGLGPYCVPLYTLIASGLGAPSWVIGLTLGGFLWTKPEEIVRNAGWRAHLSVDGTPIMGDIRRAGYVTAAVWVPTVGLALVGGVLCQFGGGWGMWIEQVASALSRFWR